MARTANPHLSEIAIDAVLVEQADRVRILIGALCNIALDPLLIYGLGMGVRGAALATITSQAISCAWCLMFLSGE